MDMANKMKKPENTVLVTLSDNTTIKVSDLPYRIREMVAYFDDIKYEAYEKYLDYHKLQLALMAQNSLINIEIGKYLELKNNEESSSK